MYNVTYNMLDSEAPIVSITLQSGLIVQFITGQTVTLQDVPQKLFTNRFFDIKPVKAAPAKQDDKK